jgi:hypothetical protein
MHLPGIRGQASPTPFLDFSGSVTTGGTAQIVAPQQIGRSYLYFKNTSTADMWVGFGGARATATLSSGAVSSVTVTNAGFNYTFAPQVVFLGGGRSNALADGVGGGATFPAPSNPATAHCNMAAGVALNKVNTITVDNAGSGYLAAPYVYLFSDPRDPFGVYLPAASSGILLAAASVPFVMDASICTTDAISVFGGTTGQTFSCFVVVN